MDRLPRRGAVECGLEEVLGRHLPAEEAPEPRGPEGKGGDVQLCICVCVIGWLVGLKGELVWDREREGGGGRGKGSVGRAYRKEEEEVAVVFLPDALWVNVV